MTLQSPSKQAPWDLRQFSQSPSALPSYFPEFHRWSEISSHSKVILVLGKARGRSEPNLSCRGAESPEWFDISPKNSARDMMHEHVRCCDEAANIQLPIAVAFWIIWIVSAEECSSFTQNLMQIHCSTCSLWVWQPHSTHAHTMASTPPLTRIVKTLFTHVYSSPLSLAARLHWYCTNHPHYINNGWTFSRQTLYTEWRSILSHLLKTTVHAYCKNKHSLIFYIVINVKYLLN